jgi:hypothetical protein
MTKKTDERLLEFLCLYRYQEYDLKLDAKVRGLYWTSLLPKPGELEYVQR